MKRACRHLANLAGRIRFPMIQLQLLPIFLSIFLTSMGHQSHPINNTNTIYLKILAIQLLNYLTRIFSSLSVACTNLVAGEALSFEYWCTFWLLPDGQIDLSQKIAKCTSKRSGSPTCKTIFDQFDLNFLLIERHFTCDVSYLIVQHKITRRQTNGLNVGIEFCLLLDFDHSNVVEKDLIVVIFML